MCCPPPFPVNISFQLWPWLTGCSFCCGNESDSAVHGTWTWSEIENESETWNEKQTGLFTSVLCPFDGKYCSCEPPEKTVCIPSPAATASFAEAVAVVGIVATVPTLVTPVIGVKLASTGTPTAFSGETCWHLHPNTGTTEDPEDIKKKKQLEKPVVSRIWIHKFRYNYTLVFVYV